MAFDAFVALQNRIPNRAFRLQIRDVDAAPSQSRFDKIGVRAPKRWWRWPSLVCSTVDRLRIQRRRKLAHRNRLYPLIYILVGRKLTVL